MLPDIEIARQTKLLPIDEVAAKLGIDTMTRFSGILFCIAKVLAFASLALALSSARTASGATKDPFPPDNISVHFLILFAMKSTDSSS